MRTGKPLKRIAAAILCAVLLMALTAPSLAFAQERKTVRVGWHEPPYFVMDQYGRGSGYSYEYQRKLAAYTGWEYEYVKGSWSELLQMLKDGEIDLMSDVSYTEERAESILYASLPMGTDTYYILVAPDNTEITADYASLNGKRVGAAKGSFQSGLFLQWAEEHGIQAELVELTSTEEESLLLLGTELDAIATMDVYADPATAVPVWKIGSSDFYFAVSKDRSDLLPELNAAMNQIQEENEYYNQQLHETYLTNNEVKHFLSTAEQEWLAGHGPIRVGYQDDYQALLDRLQSRVNVLSENASIRLRMGVMLWREGLEPVQLLDRAHTASVRSHGSDKHVVLYDQEMQERERLNDRLLNDLDRALREHEFKVYYQPKFNVTVEPPILSSAEALVRWQHPELGMVPPNKFIPLFEENGLIEQLDYYVWRETAEQLQALRSMGCDVIQGYFFSKPVPAEEYERFIEERLSLSGEEVTSAEQLRRSFRPVDHICRVGNARFAIVMSRVDSGIREQVEQKIDRINEGLTVSGVSLAVGVAFADRTHPGESIQKDAESALESLKKQNKTGCAFY